MEDTGNEKKIHGRTDSKNIAGTLKAKQSGKFVVTMEYPKTRFTYGNADTAACR